MIVFSRNIINKYQVLIYENLSIFLIKISFSRGKNTSMPSIAAMSYSRICLLGPISSIHGQR